MRIALGGIDWFVSQALREAAAELGVTETIEPGADVAFHCEQYDESKAGQINILLYHGLYEVPTIYLRQISGVISNSSEVVLNYTQKGVWAWMKQLPIPKELVENPPKPIEMISNPVAFVLRPADYDVTTALIAKRHGLKVYAVDPLWVPPELQECVIELDDVSLENIIRIGVSAPCVIPIVPQYLVDYLMPDPFLLVLQVCGACVLCMASSQWIDLAGCIVAANDSAQYEEYIYRAMHDDTEFQFYRRVMRPQLVSRFGFRGVDYLSAALRFAELLSVKEQLDGFAERQRTASWTGRAVVGEEGDQENPETEAGNKTPRIQTIPSDWGKEGFDQAQVQPAVVG